MAIRMSGLVSNMDTDSIIKELMSAQSLKKTKIENKITKLEWKQEIWKGLNTKIYSLYTGSLSKMRMQSNYSTKKATSSNETAVTATADTTAASGAHTVGVSKLASAQYITGGKVSLNAGVTTEDITTSTTLEDLGVDSGSVITITNDSSEDDPTTVNVTDTTTIADFVTACKNAGLNASFDKTQGRFFISSEESGAANSFSITSTYSGDDNSEYLGLSATATDNPMTQVAAQDAAFTLDGASLTSESNTVTVNGLTLQLSTETTSDATITVSNDTDSVYNMVKSFLTDYNTLVEELNDDYYADSARGYDPLTDDEKEAMTDDEVEKWETKIKDSLLRRDDKLGTLLSAMKTTLSTSVEVNGESYSLSSYGITSAVYTEKGKLHIDGDSEDSLVADQTDKLKAALEEDPDTVMEVISTICGNLYSTMQDKMKSTTLNSALTFYNDKEMTKTLTKYEDELDTMEDKLQDIEDRYYEQFSAMETAMSNLNSQQSALSSLLSS